MTTTRLLTLNRDEVLVLADRTLNTDCGTPDLPIVAPRLLIKLGILYLELVDPASEAIREGTIAVTEAEAWLLRGKVNSGDKMSSDSKFGIKLLRKIYRLLIDFDADVDAILSAETDGEKMDQWHHDALAVWKRGQAGEEGNDTLQPV